MVVIIVGNSRLGVMSSSKRKSNSFTGRKSNSSIVNFLSLVVGFTVLVIIALTGFNYFFGSKDASETSADASNAVDSKEAIVERPLLSKSLSVEAFAKEIATAKVTDLMDYLKQSEVLGAMDERVPARIERNRRRVMAAEQLMLQDCTDEEFRLAAKAKLLALSSIYNTSLDTGFQIEVSEDADELKRFAQGLSLEPDDAIRLDARLTIAGIELIESAKLKDAQPNVDQAANSIIELLKDFPDEEKVVGYLQMVYPSILELNPDFGLQLTQKLIPHGAEFKQKHQAQLFRNFYDLAKLATTKLKSKRENVFAGGEEATQELYSIADELASDPNGGEMIIQEFQLLVHWMEQEQEFARALKAYQSIIESAAQRSTTELAEKAREIGRDGILRCNLIGKQFEFRGERIVGGQLDADQYKGYFVVVMFLTFERMNVEALINEIYPEIASLANRQVRFIGVTLDKNPDPAFSALATHFPLIEFLQRGKDDDQPPSIYGQYPAKIVPQLILINPDGVVIRTGKSPTELSQVVNEEMLKFNKQ